MDIVSQTNDLASYSSVAMPMVLGRFTLNKLQCHHHVDPNLLKNTRKQEKKLVFLLRKLSYLELFEPIQHLIRLPACFIDLKTIKSKFPRRGLNSMLNELPAVS